MLSHFSRVQLFVTLRTIAHKALSFMEFSRQKYWSGLLCPPLGDPPNPGIEPMSLMAYAVAGGFFANSAPRKSIYTYMHTHTHTQIFAATWMDLEIIILSEVSQTEKDKCILSLTCGI